MNFALPADHGVKLKRVMSTSILLGNRNKVWNIKVAIIQIVISDLGGVTRTGGLGNKDMGGNCPNYSIAEIGQNTGDLRRLVTQTSVRNQQLTLVGKTRKGVKMTNNNNYNNNLL